jgi:hypothetical protein
MSTNLVQASRQWATRPADQRFTSLPALLERCNKFRASADAKVIPNRAINVISDPADDLRGILLEGPNGVPVAPSNWSFGQLAGLAKFPTAPLRELPSPLVADILNYKLQVQRGVESVGVMTAANVDGAGERILACATGPNYGRMWNADITSALIERFGDGVNGYWRVPGEFGKPVEVTKENTTLYASDRDMFIFLADEERRIEIPNRRDGKAGGLARGFFLWNSELGNRSLGFAAFLFDYACRNRTVWGAEGYREIRISHTAGVGYRWIEEVIPQLEAYAKSSSEPVVRQITNAQGKSLGNEDDVRKFLVGRKFSGAQASAIMAAHVTDEGKPIENVWDAVTGITAYARALPYQDERVELEREAGRVLELAR